MVHIKKLAQLYIDAMPDIVKADLQEIKTAIELNDKLSNYLQDDIQVIETKDGKTVELFPSNQVNAILKFKDQVNKKIENVQRSIGMLPAHTPASIYQTLIINQDNRQISNKIIHLLGSKLNDVSDDLPLEAEIASFVLRHT